MLRLSFESSCDETAAALVRDGRTVERSLVRSQVEEHRLYGGVVPEIASRRHIEAIAGLYGAVFEGTGYGMEAVEAVAVTYAPGLIGALLVGVNFAKSLSMACGKPLVPVHHLRGHIAANYLAHPKLEPPFLCLVVSGGHSHIVEVLDYTQFRVVGRTRDDAAGEAFDKAARALGFPYPGGVYMDKAAAQGNPKAYAFPHPKLSTPYDFSFSGLKTAVVNLLHNASQKGEGLNPYDVAAAFQETVTDILTEKLFGAAEELGYRRIVAAGGVSANSALRRKLEAGCRERGWEFFVPPLALCGDNAAMIGAQGYYEYLAGVRGGLDLNAYATMEI